jgi:hypothetical protein
MTAACPPGRSFIARWLRTGEGGSVSGATLRLTDLGWTAADEVQRDHIMVHVLFAANIAARSMWRQWRCHLPTGAHAHQTSVFLPARS